MFCFSKVLLVQYRFKNVSAVSSVFVYTEESTLVFNMEFGFQSRRFKYTLLTLQIIFLKI